MNYASIYIHGGEQVVNKDELTRIFKALKENIVFPELELDDTDRHLLHKTAALYLSDQFIPIEDEDEREYFLCFMIHRAEVGEANYKIHAVKLNNCECYGADNGRCEICAPESPAVESLLNKIDEVINSTLDHSLFDKNGEFVHRKWAIPATVNGKNVLMGAYHKASDNGRTNITEWIAAEQPEDDASGNYVTTILEGQVATLLRLMWIDSLFETKNTV